MEAHEQLQEVLLQRVGFEIVTQTVKEHQIRYVGRVRQNRMVVWLEVATQLLIRSENAGWSLDLSRQYFVRDSKLLYGWRIIVQGENVAQYMTQIVGIIQATRTPTKQLDEVQLHANPNRNAMRRGRGAQLLGTAVVGPLANDQLGM